MRRFTVYASDIEHRGYFASPFSETEWKVIYPMQNSFEYVTVTPGEDAEAQIRKWIDEHIAETTAQQQTETASMSAYYANLLAELTEKFARYANLHMTSYESVTGRFLGKDLRIRATDATVRKWINSFNNGSKICQKELIGLTLAGSEPSGEYDKNIYHLGLQSIEPKESKQVKGSKKMNRKFTKYPKQAVKASSAKIPNTIDVLAEAKARLPYITKMSGTNEKFQILFNDDMAPRDYTITGELLDGVYKVDIAVEDRHFAYVWNKRWLHHWTVMLKPNQLKTLFDRWSREYHKDGQKSGDMSLTAILRGWSPKLSDEFLPNNSRSNDVNASTDFSDFDDEDGQVTIEDIKEAAAAHNYTGNIEDEIAELGGDPEQLYMIYDDIVSIGTEVAQKNLGNWRFLLPSETEFDEPVISTDSGYYVVCARGSIQLVPIEAEELFGGEEFDEFDEEGGPSVTASTDYFVKSSTAAQGDVTAPDLADLMRARYETFSAENGTSADDLVEYGDQFYTNLSYREEVAEYIISRIPRLKKVKMSSVDAVIVDVDSELLISIYIDGKKVGTCHTWYVADRYDYTMTAQ